MSAQEWLDAPYAEQVAEDKVRPVTEADVYEARDEVSDQQERVDVLETDVPGVRDLSTRDELEDSDRARRERIPTVDEQAAILARHHVAYLEIRAPCGRSSRGTPLGRRPGRRSPPTRRAATARRGPDRRGGHWDRH